MIVKLSRYAVVGLAILVLCGTVFAARSGVTGKEAVYEPMSFNFNNADLGDMLRIVAKISGMNIVVDPGINGSVTCKLKKIPWDKGLKKMLKPIGLNMYINGNVVRVYRVDSKNEKQIQAAAQRKYSGKAINLNVKNADLVSVLKKLAKQAKKKIKIPGDVKGRVSCNLVQIPIDQVMDLILQINGLNMKQEGNTIKIF